VFSFPPFLHRLSLWPLLTQLTTTLPHVGSTAPFTADTNHGLDYRSGMIQTWNKFCFTTGYIEVAVTFPGPNENTRGYVSRGFGAVKTKLLSLELFLAADIGWKVSILFVGDATYTTPVSFLPRSRSRSFWLCSANFLTTFFISSGLVYGRWVTWRDLAIQLRPMGRGLIRMFCSTTALSMSSDNSDFACRYDSCDVGTFPNQTNPDHLGPAAALHSNASRAKYNNELSWLSGQRLS